MHLIGIPFVKINQFPALTKPLLRLFVPPKKLLQDAMTNCDMKIHCHLWQCATHVTADALLYCKGRARTQLLHSSCRNLPHPPSLISVICCHPEQTGICCFPHTLTHTCRHVTTVHTYGSTTNYTPPTHRSAICHTPALWLCPRPFVCSYTAS